MDEAKQWFTLEAMSATDYNTLQNDTEDWYDLGPPSSAITIPSTSSNMRNDKNGQSTLSKIPTLSETNDVESSNQLTAAFSSDFNHSAQAGFRLILQDSVDGEISQSHSFRQSLFSSNATSQSVDQTVDENWVSLQSVHEVHSDESNVDWVNLRSQDMHEVYRPEPVGFAKNEVPSSAQTALSTLQQTVLGTPQQNSDDDNSFVQSIVSSSNLKSVVSSASIGNITDTPITKFLGAEYRKTELLLQELKQLNISTSDKEVENLSKLSLHLKGKGFESESESIQPSESKNIKNEENSLVEQELISDSIDQTSNIPSFKITSEAGTIARTSDKESEGELILSELSTNKKSRTKRPKPKYSSTLTSASNTASTLEPIKEVPSPDIKLSSYKVKLISNSSGEPETAPSRKQQHSFTDSKMSQSGLAESNITSFNAAACHDTTNYFGTSNNQGVVNISTSSEDTDTLLAAKCFCNEAKVKKMNKQHLTKPRGKISTPKKPVPIEVKSDHPQKYPEKNSLEMKIFLQNNSSTSPNESFPRNNNLRKLWNDRTGAKKSPILQKLEMLHQMLEDQKQKATKLQMGYETSDNMSSAESTTKVVPKYRIVRNIADETPKNHFSTSKTQMRSCQYCQKSDKSTNCPTPLVSSDTDSKHSFKHAWTQTGHRKASPQLPINTHQMKSSPHKSKDHHRNVHSKRPPINNKFLKKQDDFSILSDLSAGRYKPLYTAWFQSVVSDVSEVVPLCEIPSLSNKYNEHILRNTRCNRKSDLDLQKAFLLHKQRFIYASKKRVQDVKDRCLLAKERDISGRKSWLKPRPLKKPARKFQHDFKRPETKRVTRVMGFQEQHEKKMAAIRKNRLKLKQYDMRNRLRFLPPRHPIQTYAFIERH